MSVAIAQHVGARNVVIAEINDHRLELARRLGATRVINVEREQLGLVMNELNLTVLQSITADESC